jgi:BolA protein
MNTKIETLLRTSISDLFFLNIDDQGACSGDGGSKFALIIVSDSFKGEPLLQRHRRINEILAEPLKSIHALQLKTWTVEEYEKKKKNAGS